MTPGEVNCMLDDGRGAKASAIAGIENDCIVDGSWPKLWAMRARKIFPEFFAVSLSQLMPRLAIITIVQNLPKTFIDYLISLTLPSLILADSSTQHYNFSA